MKLEIGYKHAFEVRKEFYSANADGFTMLYLSDLHFNRFSAETASNIASTIDALDPDIILLGGDYADSKKGLAYFDTLLKAIAHRKNIFAIAGNHDHFFGIAAIQKIIADNDIVWIEKRSVTVKIKNTSVQIDGNKPVTEKSSADLSILCLHKPTGILKYKDNYNIVLAGHLHGSQFVLWQNGDALYPGKLFYKWNILKQRVNNCQYYISKGLGDTLPARFNCKKDMIFVTVGQSLISSNT